MSVERNISEPLEEVSLGVRDSVLAEMARISTLDFKTVLVDSHRKGLRLEAAFWDALDDYCRSEAITRSQLLKEILSSQPEQDFNTTSLIRTFLVAAQGERLREMGEMFARDQMIALLQQAPVAAFAMGRDKRMLRANREFLRLLRIILGDPRSELSLTSLKLSLAVPVEQIFEQAVKSGEPMVSGILIEISKRQRRANARIVPVPGNPVDAVVGYIVI